MDSLDVVELVMVLEEIFDAVIPNSDADRFGSPQDVVDSLEALLSNKRPNEQAIAMLKGLAKKHQWPELAEGLEGPWRREQIAAIVRELLRDDR